MQQVTESKGGWDGDIPISAEYGKIAFDVLIGLADSAYTIACKLSQGVPLCACNHASMRHSEKTRCNACQALH